MERSEPERYDTILKEGWIEKRSRFRKEWRRRWMVLTPRYLSSFKNQQQYTGSTTEMIRLQTCTTVKSAEEELKKPYTFRLEIPGRSLYLCAKDAQDKEAWIGAIGRAMIRPTVMRSNSEEDALNALNA